jgi:SAM-dependent methyltransferase
MTDRIPSLGEGWSAHADEWIAYAGIPGLDSYWRYHREPFLGLVPAPGRLTVDVGCGEGRVSRDLRALGHRVLAVDLSFAMTRATATHPTGQVPAVVADSTALPLPARSADCVVAFMSLHDIDDMPGTIAELARVLVPGGRLVMAIVHPINSAGTFVGESGDQERPYVIAGSYFEPRRYVDTFVVNDLNVTFHGEHRPLQCYTEALAGAGFAIERLTEPTNPDPADKWRRIPLFLNVVAVLAGS